MSKTRAPSPAAERLPQPGESRDQNAKPRRVGAGRLEGVQTWFAIAAPGLEETVRVEVERLAGVHEVNAVAGGVEFAGPLEVGMRANLHLRVASRVLLRLGTVRARELGKLRHLLAKLPWEALVPEGDALEIRAAASGCRLYHTGAIAENALWAIADRAGERPLAPKGRAEDDDAADDEPAPVTRVLLRGRDDEFTVSVDTSGALLHRRGFRLEAGKAPLRETLAAGVLALCGHDPERPLVDGMCGAGTFALEAAARARARAPGIARSFTFERWPGFDPATWARLKEDARAAERPAPAAVHASDRDARMVELAKRNAVRAGLDEALRFEVAAFGESTSTIKGPPGLVVLNPPYGHRLGTRTAAQRVYRDIGRALKTKFRGWRAGVLVPDRGLENALGLRIAHNHALSNGGLRVRLLVIELT